MHSPKSARHRHRARAGGMTLVELLLTVALFSAILAAAGGLIVTMARTQTFASRAAGPAEQLQRALDQVEQDIESAQPFFGIPAQGTATQYEFARVERDAWVRVRLWFEPGDAGGAALMRETSPWNASDGQPARRERLVSVERGAFAYARQDPDGLLVWDGAWDGAQDGVPRLVRVTPGVVLREGQEPAVFSRVMRYPAGALPVMEPSP